jgi:hypothetical protein
MIRYLYNRNEEISLVEFKEGIDYEGTDEEFKHNIWGGRSNKSQYGKLWSNLNNTTKINENIKKYIDTL